MDTVTDKSASAALDEPTLRALVGEGLGDTEIAQRLTEGGQSVSSRTVRRRREEWGIESTAKRGRKPAPEPREAALFVPLTDKQLQAVHDYAEAAGHASTAPWVRRLVLELPELAARARGGGLDALPQMVAIVLGDPPIAKK